MEAFLSMDQEAWITAHINAYTYFGGASRILVPDNLKTGVIRNGKDETIINKTYLELAEHYGTAVLPARVRSPTKTKHRLKVSSAISPRRILAKLRNQQYLSLFDLNEDLHHLSQRVQYQTISEKGGKPFIPFQRRTALSFPLPKITL